MRAHVALLALAALPFVTRPAFAGPEIDATPETPEHPVTATLVTDATAIAPGTPFLAGVELRMRLGWHVYWKNPGDAGLSTELAFDVPEGFTVGDVRFPVPETFQQPGDIHGYGYSHPVVLFAEITPPASLEPGTSISLGVKADWLACERVCIPGGVTLETELPVARRASFTGRGDAWRATLPLGPADIRPFIDSVRSTKLEDGRVAYELELRWLAVPPDDAEWIPAPPDAIELRDVAVHTDGQKTQVTFDAVPRTGSPLAQKTMETVVAYHTTDGKRHGVVVPVGLEVLASASGS